MDDTILDRDAPSGRFVLRISPGLHAVLRKAAGEAELSLNEYCARKLAGTGAPVVGPASELVERAIHEFGDRLLGVLVFGSWARGEAAQGSDVDVLLVVDPRVPIVRRLYHPWDELPLRWEGMRLEVHIVHPPEDEATPTALWAEAALDGVVLFDPAFNLSRRLSALRRSILAGDASRRSAHGQAYWVAPDPVFREPVPGDRAAGKPATGEPG